MASSKHLRQLLKEVQEPFILHNYINERRRQLKKPVQVQRRRKPNSENSTFCHINLCKNACFLSSPDVQNSPLFDFSASPCKNSNTNVFIQIPSSTAALLLEAALRIQSNQSDDTQKTKTTKNLGFSFIRSILKKVTSRGQMKSKENKEDRIQVSVKDILRWNSMDGQKLETTPETTKGVEEKRVSDVEVSSSRISSLWSENIEEKSTELDTSTSMSENSQETDCVVVDQRKRGGFVNSQEKRFCSSEFVQQNLSSPGRHSPKMDLPSASPAIQSSGSDSPVVASPKRYKKQVVENEPQTNTVEQKLDEEKEHNSPVSVLDPNFEENDDEQQEDDQEEEEEEEEEQDGIKLETSFAFVNRTKQQLLDKLRRFELLAELDPIELEKRIAEEENEDDEEAEYSDDEDSVSEHNEKVNVFAKEVVSESNFFKLGRVPLDMKKLLKRIITKEGEDLKSSDEVFKEVDSKTIDMMIEFDFRKDGSEWAKYQDHVQEMGEVVELSIFGFLIEELAVELIEDRDH